MRLDLPESNVADVVVVSSVDADNPPKQLRVTMIAILTARSNIFTTLQKHQKIQTIAIC